MTTPDDIHDSPAEEHTPTAGTRPDTAPAGGARRVGAGRTAGRRTLSGVPAVAWDRYRKGAADAAPNRS